MVGLSVLVSTWSNGLALVNDFRERVKFADGFVMKTGGLGEEEQAFLRTIPGIVSASPVGYLPLRVAEQDRLGTGEFAPANVVCVGFVPEEFLSFNRVDWIQGSPEVAIPRLSDGDAVLVAKEFLIARKLGETRFEVVASPDYLQRHGVAGTVADLEEHDCIVVGEGNGPREWAFDVDGETVRVPVSGRVIVNALELARQGAIEGLGIARLPAFLVVKDLHTGRLVRVLDKVTK